MSKVLSSKGKFAISAFMTFGCLGTKSIPIAAGILLIKAPEPASISKTFPLINFLDRRYISEERASPAKLHSYCL